MDLFKIRFLCCSNVVPDFILNGFFFDFLHCMRIQFLPITGRHINQPSNIVCNCFLLYHLPTQSFPYVASQIRNMGSTEVLMLHECLLLALIAFWQSVTSGD